MVFGTKTGPAEAGTPEKAVAIDSAMMANLFISLTLGKRMYPGHNAAEGNWFHFGWGGMTYVRIR